MIKKENKFGNSKVMINNLSLIKLTKHSFGAHNY
jgi:hypothetical protein